MRVVKTISLAINGRDIKAEVEPRLHLADFLRENQFLTATHIGCEHGVCGACTVLIDGAPARSCITFAVAADRAAITTLEGFENDPVMDVLREAFSEHHALQCGFCTPGMLMTARDIVTRVPEADENRIRQELSGNLCRCTGYVGIVEAVQSALKTIKASATCRILDRAARSVRSARILQQRQETSLDARSLLSRKAQPALGSRSGISMRSNGRRSSGTAWNCANRFPSASRAPRSGGFSPTSIRSRAACPVRV